MSYALWYRHKNCSTCHMLYHYALTSPPGRSTADPAPSSHTLRAVCRITHIHRVYRLDSCTQKCTHACTCTHAHTHAHTYTHTHTLPLLFLQRERFHKKGVDMFTFLLRMQTDLYTGNLIHTYFNIYMITQESITITISFFVQSTDSFSKVTGLVKDFLHVHCFHHYVTRATQSSLMSHYACRSILCLLNPA